MTNPQDSLVDDPDFGTPPPPKSPRQKDWEELLQVAPELQYLIKSKQHESRPPAEISDAVFLGLIVSLLNPVKRAILTAVIRAIEEDHIDEKINAALFREET